VSEDDAATWAYLAGVMLAIPVLIFAWARNHLSSLGGRDWTGSSRSS
jgi:hypothetical protein